jgi:hypothetical protein
MLAVAVYQLSGNLLVGIGAVTALNVLGVLGVILAMRRCWNDVSLPRTRALLGRSRTDALIETAASNEQAPS